jgi:hypothetical protein
LLVDIEALLEASDIGVVEIKTGISIKFRLLSFETSNDVSQPLVFLAPYLYTKASPATVCAENRPRSAQAGVWHTDRGWECATCSPIIEAWQTDPKAIQRERLGCDSFPRYFTRCPSVLDEFE